MLDQISLVAYHYLQQFGYQRRFGIVKHSSILGPIASIPYENHTVGDYRHTPILWVYFDDREWYNQGEIVFAGISKQEPASLPPYHRGLHGISALSDRNRAEELAEDTTTGPEELTIDDTATSLEAGQPTDGATNGNAIPLVIQPNAAPAGEGDGSNDEDIFTGPYITSNDLYYGNKDANSVFPVVDSQENIAPTSSRSKSHTPPPNAPTGPANICWNCSGQGHRSSESWKFSILMI